MLLLLQRSDELQPLVTLRQASALTYPHPTQHIAVIMMLAMGERMKNGTWISGTVSDIFAPHLTPYHLHRDMWSSPGLSCSHVSIC